VTDGIARGLPALVSRGYPLLLSLTMVLAKLPVASLPCSGDATTYLLPTVYWLLDNGADWYLEGGDERGTSGFGHPPFFFHVLAGAMEIVGDSRVVARVVVGGFAALGVYCTARLALTMFGASAGWAAGTFLLLSPLYFTQAGLVRLSVPLTALGAATALAALQGNLPAYLAASCALVLTKEPGVCLIAAVLPALWLRNRRLRLWPKVLRVAPYAIPLLLFAVWIGLNQWKWGKIVNRPFIKWAPMHPLPRVRQLLFSGGQWPLTLIGVAWLLRRAKWNASGRLLAGGVVALLVFLTLSLPPIGLGREITLKLMTAVLAGAILLQPLRAIPAGIVLLGLAIIVTTAPLFALREGLPRYLLPALPFGYVLAAGALTTMFRRWLPLVWGLCAAVLVLGWRGPSSEGGDMAYVRSVRAVREATRFLEDADSDDAVVVSCLSVSALEEPRMGYVQRPLHAFVAEEVGRRVRPERVSAFLFRFLPASYAASVGQEDRLVRELQSLEATLGAPLVPEKVFESPYDRVIVFRRN
jgi:4-amino-4-deoxy-L-arabinose transferase-like glycosyltransferase